MNCKKAQKHFPDLLTGELVESKRIEIEEHIAECAFCKKEWEKLSSLWEKIGMLPEEQPSKKMHERFYAMLEAYKQGVLQEKATPKQSEIFNDWLERWWPRKPAFQFAFAVGLLIVGVLIGSFFTPRVPVNGEVAQLRDEVHTMRQMVALSLMQQQSASDRLKGVSLSYQVQQPDSDVLSALLYTLNNDPNVNVRLAAADALYLFHDKKMVKQGLVESLSRQESPLIQIALIDLMIEIRERQAVEAFRQLVKENKLNPAVKERAQWGIQQLS
jgi:hypothetical protein